MDKKPNVIPTREQIDSANAERERIEAYEAEKRHVTNEVYTSSVSDSNVTHYDAVEQMRRRTEQQMRDLETKGVVQEPSFAEKSSSTIYGDESRARNEEQMRLRDEQLKKNLENTQNFQRQTEEATNRHVNEKQVSENNNQQNKNTFENMNSNNNNYSTPPPSTPIVNNSSDYGNNPSNTNNSIYELSQPNYNAPFDVIPLPSKGRFYPNRKESIKIGYMTTADENILTSPNLLQSGEFLEILINRKILEQGLRYKDLLPGDRNAIMIWLRATGYGEMYPITILDEINEPFDTVVNLNDLKTIELPVDPDEEGLYSFVLPISKVNVRFKLLTCGDVDSIEKIIKKENDDNVLVNNTSTYTLEKMLVEVNGSRDRQTIRDFANGMRLGDAKAFTQYVETLDFGIDLNINVETPGGGSVATFLPLNLNFFWPNIRL